MSTKKIMNAIAVLFIAIAYSSCVPYVAGKKENRTVPAKYAASIDSNNTAKVKWKDFFSDPDLSALIDTALNNNQELNIMLQEIQISKNEIRAKKGEYLPFVGVVAGAADEKAGRYTETGAVEANTEIKPGLPMPEPLPNFQLGVSASWEIDIWKKLRNSKKAAVSKYLATVEGKNFMVTNLITEIATSYYELVALDNQLEILKSNIAIQQNALEIVKLEKESARVTELAVRKFEAEVFKNQSRQYYIIQQIIETENRINFLVGRFPQVVNRKSKGFTDITMDSISAGIPTQLLQNRADIRQAEQDLIACKLNVKSAKANFYPTLRINGTVGFGAFNTKYLINTPQSLIYSLAGELVAPLINRNAIKAQYANANAKQIQSVYNYERTILTAYTEVANQLSNIGNLQKSYDLQAKQVQALNQSIDISSELFKSARADYMEVLLTQRDALDSNFELIETKQKQMNARVHIYKALGGGWN